MRQLNNEENQLGAALMDMFDGVLRFIKTG
jgi:hypothetical protein